MQLSTIGSIADENWRLLPAHFPGVTLDAFVVMPNHIHGIVVLGGDEILDWGTMGDGTTVGSGTTVGATSGRGTIYRAPTNNRAPTREQFQKPVPGSIPTIVRTFKASVTRRIGKGLNEANIWQRNYYEHIIRSEQDWHRIQNYIIANPINWATDEENW